jgi:para-nitrobenzyl esterase
MMLAGRGGSESLDAGHAIAAGSGAKDLDAGHAGGPGPTTSDADADVPIATGLTIPTAEGEVHGKQLGKTRAFLGIPYAQPPVGALRWRAPQPPAAHANLLETTDYAHICPQNLPIVGWDGRSDENCLFLNIWTPDPAPSKPLPVMVYLHGGAYQLGSGGDQYDGQKLSEAQNIVTVTLNYRLGALGFLAHPALTAENGSSGSGNYGLLDQQQALTWLRQNISEFGGAANRITIFGESAGGNSVCAQLASPLSRGLFDRAIIQSGYCFEHAQTQAEADATGKRLEADMGCSSASDPLACLRAAAAVDLVAKTALTGQYLGGIFFIDKNKSYFFEPSVDGRVLTDQLEKVFACGSFQKVPVLHGANSYEGGLFLTPFPFYGKSVDTQADFDALINARYPSRAADISARYAPAANATWNDAVAELMGDSVFLCPSRRLAGYIQKADQANYLYRFAGTLDALLLPNVSGRSFHGADTPFVLGNDFPLGTIPMAEQPLTAIVQGYWVHFATAGAPGPGSAGTPNWMAYDPQSKNEFVLEMPVAYQALTKVDECALWQSIAEATLH